MPYLYSVIHPFYTLFIFLRQAPLFLRFPSLLKLDFLAWRYTLGQNIYRVPDMYLSFDRNASPMTYGEITYSGMCELIRRCQSIHPVRSFLDLGGGLAKPSICVSLLFKIPSVSVEIRSDLVTIAQRLSGAIKLNSVDVVEADLFAWDVSQSDCIFISTTCFSSDSVSHLAKRLASQLDFESIVMTTSEPLDSTLFDVKAVCCVFFSWGRGHVYLQTKRRYLN